ncbi:hypothetical protein M2137_000180 [Parabacteroides sp. PFB2-10]|uniref:head GIN domain-containing protein n=1 Tax=Parabacteroides sp. PFB2-10 TaxID=1742405 RepID=UPI002473A43E|nr:head GIN domain-containing protein [Parabacteroides sp. PFB2-10]MDH6311430.1 hypothetical protein [Parabacteroides sp. PFB2-10]
MKANITWIILLLMTFPTAFAAEKERGNGQMETKTFQVDQYSWLYLGENIEYDGNSGRNLFKKRKDHFPTFYYTQAKGNATLEITIDENLLEWLVVEQKDQVLYIKAKENIRIHPTQLIIEGQSADLSSVDIIGCMNFVAKETLTVDRLAYEISGVGDITLDKLACKDFACEIKGVGNVYLTGKIAKGNYRLSGVGKVRAYDCEVENLTCHVSGVGDMEVKASKHLKASTSGVGSIKYKGDALLDKSSTGIGRVKKVNE